MNTKIKLSADLTNSFIINNKNFLNSQNYILGSKEKRNILLKYFYITKWQDFLDKLSLISSILFSGYLLFLIPLFVLYFIYRITTDLIILKLVSVFLVLISISMFFYYLFHNGINYIKLKNIKDYLKEKGKNNDVITVLFFIKVVFVFSPYILILGDYIGNLSLYYIFKFILFIISFIFSGYLFFNFNFLNLILLPFIFIFIFFKSLFYYFYLFILNKNKYRVLKSNINKPKILQLNFKSDNINKLIII